MFCECGTGSFKHVDEDPEDLGCTGGGGSPRDRERRKHGGGKVNPYAERGLDRFSVVLSELETRRAKILRRVGSDTEGLVLVRFVQSNGHWTPIVVKLPEEPPSKKGATRKPRAAAAASTAAAPLRPPAPASPRSPLDDPAASPREKAEGASSAATTAKAVATSKTKVPARKLASFSWGRRMRRPSRYWPSVIVLTLVSLAVYGRVFAICVASIWWYVLPTLGGSGDAEDDARRGPRPAGMRMSMSMEKKKVVSPHPHPHAKKGSISGGVYEVVRSPKGKRG